MFLNKEIKINRVMHVLVAILLSIFTSHGAEHRPKYVSIDKELIPYVIEFDNMMRARGVDIDWNYMDLSIRLANIKRSEILGVARGMHHATAVNVMINQNTWREHTSNQKLWILFHELAHDLFDIEHNEIELMMTRLPRFVSQSDLNRVMWEMVEYLQRNNKWNIKNTKQWQESLKNKGRKLTTQIGEVGEKVQDVLKKEYIQNVKELLAEHIDQETVMSKLGELIDNGDYRAIDLWMKYAYGTPKQTMDINTTGDVDINFKLSNLIRFKEEE